MTALLQLVDATLPILQLPPSPQKTASLALKVLEWEGVRMGAMRLIVSAAQKHPDRRLGGTKEWRIETAEIAAGTDITVEQLQALIKRIREEPGTRTKRRRRIRGKLFAIAQIPVLNVAAKMFVKIEQAGKLQDAKRALQGLAGAVGAVGGIAIKTPAGVPLLIAGAIIAFIAGLVSLGRDSVLRKIEEMKLSFLELVDIADEGAAPKSDAAKRGLQVLEDEGILIPLDIIIVPPVAQVPTVNGAPGAPPPTTEGGGAGALLLLLGLGLLLTRS